MTGSKPEIVERSEDGLVLRLPYNTLAAIVALAEDLEHIRTGESARRCTELPEDDAENLIALGSLVKTRFDLEEVI